VNLSVLTGSSEQAPDPLGARGAIARYRDLAKYVVTMFAAIGALLAAGTQLSSLGKLDFDRDSDRLVAAIVALAVALGAVMLIVNRALSVLKPVEVSLDSVLADTKLANEIVAGPGAATSRDELENIQYRLRSDTIEEDDLKIAQQDRDAVLDRAALLKTKDAFNNAWKWMLGAGIVGAAAIGVFAWAANPPDPKPPAGEPSRVVRPSPVPLTFALSEAGRDKLRGALGKRCVKEGAIRALSIGGKEGAPLIVVLPSAGCRPQQFTLSSDLGKAISRRRAPSK
jgi:hypothetical protein